MPPTDGIRANRDLDQPSYRVDLPGPSVRARRYTLAFRALGCQVAAHLVASEPEAARDRLAALRLDLEAAERVLSRFRPDSELSRLNRAAGQPVPVSPLLWAVIRAALRAAGQSGGLYDPTVIDALEAAGYDRPFDQLVARPERPTPPAPAASWTAIRLDPALHTVYLPPGVRLDLAGVAKAWLAERAAARLARLGPCLIDAGGDLVLRGAPPGQAGWPVAVADPLQPERDLALLLLRDAGLATSGRDYRRWRRAGQSQHHIIDPRTRRPAATDLLSATVVAGDLTTANHHALVALVLGMAAAQDYLARQVGVEALLVRADGVRAATPGFERYVCAWYETSADG
jgi:thiamine biosynthesis lipoprotein